MNDDATVTRPMATAVLPSNADLFGPGTIVADRYRIVAPLGRGGMGAVYRADDLRLGQAVALKFLPPGLEHDIAARDRLTTEVRNARSVSHPNICRVYDLGEAAGRLFLTMEYIDGEDLASLLRRIGRLPVPKALEIARHLCAGLAAAHERGLLHRDLKPANIMIDGRGRARITDFGLAVETSSEGSPADIAGTFAYMAPERFEGRPATVQSDLYGLGLILYEVLTGKPAVTASTFDGWRRAHSDSTPSSPGVLVGEIDPALERLVLRCLEKDPSRRPASAAQVGAALPGGDPLAAALAAGETPSPELVAASGQEGTLARGSAWLWFGASVAATLAVVVLLARASLASALPMDLSPDVLTRDARRILVELGYAERPVDSAWWFRADDEARHWLARRAANGSTREAIAALRPSPILFRYRQSPRKLVTRDLLLPVSWDDPPAIVPGDASVELDMRGRLTALRVRPPDYEAAPAPRAVDWTRVFAATGFAPGDFAVVEPQWAPPVGADTRAAWDGTVDGSRYRIEAAGYHGRVVAVRVIAPHTAAEPFGPERIGSMVRRWHGGDESLRATAVAMLLTLAFAAIIAYSHIVNGRSDRNGARRVAYSVFVAAGVLAAFNRHWFVDPVSLLRLVFAHVGITLAMASAIWLVYVAVEPYGRRRWPYLLVASARLLDGRWRDPLVGRALLVGVMAGCGLAASAPATATVAAWLGAPPPVDGVAVSGLRGLPWLLEGVSFAFFDGLGDAMGLIVVVVIGWSIFRRAGPTWAYAAAGLSIALGATLVHDGWRLLPALVAALLWGATNVAVSSRSGILAYAVANTVFGVLIGVPFTLDFSRWYAWQAVAAAAFPLGLAVWGFLNVLGRQSIFPADEH